MNGGTSRRYAPDGGSRSPSDRHDRTSYLPRGSENLFFVLPDSERTQDCGELMALSKEDPVLSVAKIRHRKHWSDLRIRKTLNYMVEKKYCRFESSYKDGELYYFPEQ